ncbi:3-deoxy-manno-octulosonate cytidylyltransferase [Pararhodobacter oceanensis]|uniref:3-deoxy-manno-octulosonate cytidylyltransferase n=1 Tax=Pararhodobacter oceanensis TaxID=2172121 RepID=UPI003A924A0B
MREAVIVIPARYASTRYPAKPLAKLRGATGESRSLLERSTVAARAAAEATPGVTGIYIATDDARIAEEAQRIGADVIMTDPDCANGTERVAQALAREGLTQEIIVNLQGDALLTPPHVVSALIEAMRADASRQVATPVLRCDREALENFQSDRRAGRVGATTVVCDYFGNAMYFSKEVIPFTGALSPEAEIPVFHHVGLYAYTPKALQLYAKLPQGALERIEGLEQLRFLEHGHKIAAVEVSAPGAAFWELNNPSDVPLIEAYLARMGMA